MKLSIRLYRVAKIQTNHLLAAAGLPEDATGDQLLHEIQDRFGPLAYRFKIFMDGSLGRVSLVGMEVMGFDLRDPRVPQAGIVEHDPLIAEDVHRVDGALHGELARLGVFSDVEEFEWRMAYEVKGN